MSTPAPMSILFVDDNSSACYGLIRALEHEGFQVFQAHTGAEALRLVQMQPNLVILNVDLPDISGFEVCRRIKREPSTASIFVLHLSGYYTSSGDRVEGLHSGADGYLVKPVSPAELVAQVKALLRLRQAEQESAACEAKLQNILDHAPILVHVKDCNGRYLLVNRLWERHFHLARHQVIGRSIVDIIPPDYAKNLLANDLKVLQADAPLEFEEVLPHLGEVRTYLSIKFPLHDLEGVANAVCGISVDITEHKQVEKELAQKEAELYIARQIQQKLFPKTTPQTAGTKRGKATLVFDIGGASYPAETISGDYYDYLTLHDGCLGIAIGDVSGHGIGPALLMAELRAYLRAFARTKTDPGEILRLVNDIMLPDFENDRFITLLLVHLDPHRQMLTYASAGHLAGYLFDAAGEMKQALPSTCAPLGILEGGDFASAAPIAFEPGDLLLLLTDGLVEARASDSSLFGVQRLLDHVSIHCRLPAQEIVETLYRAARTFSQDQPQYDDITATVIKVVNSD